MGINSNASNNNQDWDSRKLIELSNNLGQGYNPGLNNAKSEEQADFWTVDKLITMSRHLSSAYGVDF